MLQLSFQKMGTYCNAGEQDNAAWQQGRILHRQVTQAAAAGVVSAAETAQATLQGSAHCW